MSDQTIDQTIDAQWHTRRPVPNPLGLASCPGWFREQLSPKGSAIQTLQETT